MRCARSAICSVLLAAGCGVVRAPSAPAVCPSYEEKIRPVLDLRCGQCHSAATGYRLGDYADTTARRDDGSARVVPGQASSSFLQAARGELSGHAAVAEAATLQDWVVRCRAAPGRLELHPRGWSTPTDGEQFHGQAVRASGYDFAACGKCHGADLRGGAAEVDCSSCHREGPQACNTCHGDALSPAPPRDLSGARAPTALGVGAHRAHAAIDCSVCHGDVKDEAHYRKPFGVRAPLQLDAGVWNRNEATCANVACHAPAVPVWTKPGKLGCDGCHGNPPPSHQTTLACESCHGPLNPATHVDGKVTLRGATCESCHAGPASAPFFDLKGANVGAHDAHRAKGVGCSECHLMPATLLAKGHLDSAPPAEVFPLDLGGLAWRQAAAPVFNAGNGTCTGVYCHGGGQFGHVDLSPGLKRAPAWTGGAAEAGCGTCHGVPPQDGTIGHNPALGLGCSACHGGSFTADGGFTTKHLDGKITGQ